MAGVAEPQEAAEREARVEQETEEDMEVDKSEEDDKTAGGLSQEEREKELQPTDGANEQQSAVTEPEKQLETATETTEGEVTSVQEGDSQPVPQASAREESAPPPPPPGPHPTEPPATATTKAPSDTLASAAPAAEEVSEGVSMEVAVLVHAEEDDLSVFSTEAAEAQKIASSAKDHGGGGGGRGSANSARDNHARDRDRDRDKSAKQHGSGRRASSSTSGLPPSSSSASKHQSARVDEGAGSNSASVVSEAAAISWSSPSDETKHGDGGGSEVGVL